MEEQCAIGVELDIDNHMDGVGAMVGVFRAPNHQGSYSVAHPVRSDTGRVEL